MIIGKLILTVDSDDIASGSTGFATNLIRQNYTMARNIMYNLQMLKMIGTLAKNNNFFTQFHLSQYTRTRIISLGIRRAPRPYRRSRAGTKLFQSIHRRITDRTLTSTNQATRSIQLHLLRTLDKCDCVKTKLVILSVINARSITPKIHQFQQELLEHHTDICGITENWIKQDDIEATTREIAPPGYKILSLPRSTGQQGGGIALVYHDHYNVKQLGKLTNTDTNTMEYQGYHMKFDNVSINLYIIYRLPSSSVIQFCNELSLILESDLDLATDKTLFVDAFNIHTDNCQDTDTINFLDTINGFNLQNLMTFPTHVKQHHLDLILDDPNNLLVHNVEPGMFLSDHCFIHCQLTIAKNPPITESVTYRKIGPLDLSSQQPKQAQFT